MSAAAALRPRTTVAVDRVDPEGRFSGYASLFGVTDLSGDQILPGAFAASIARRGADGVKLLFQHDPAAPIGRWLSIEEDARGLRVVGQLHAEVAKAREVESLMRAGILDGLSIGFRTVRARTDAKSGVRRVAEVDLWEISVVTFPMLPGARVTDPGGDPDPALLARTIRAAAATMRTAAARV
jgi:HK97 family phage prohead protease